MHHNRDCARTALVLTATALLLSGCYRRADQYPRIEPQRSVPIGTPVEVSGEDTGNAPAGPVEDAQRVELPVTLFYEDGGAAGPLPAVTREFRGVWVATVANMDWPSRRSLTTAQAQAELLRILDAARDLGLNAVIFQVRTMADAFYESALEPWSDYLTGESGRPPGPYWDPLAFAIEEAHARGLELHAWFNPFRAGFVAKRSPLASSHISRRRPDLIRTYGTFYWLDPGEPDARRQAINVIADVVRRYDVDAVHIDDYFYPYQQRDRRGRLIQFPDEATWREHGTKTGLSRADWRRSNIDRFIEDLYHAVRREKQHVRVGISPFGIWRPGHPSSVRGLDSYNELFADTRKWLNSGWADYYAPQLYWRVAAPEQPYTDLLEWWSQQNPHGRHIWAGNIPNRVATGANPWAATEILEQVRLTREHPGFSGNVHFSASSLLRNPDGLGDALRGHAYLAPALVPASPWLGGGVPERPLAHARPDVNRQTTSVAFRSPAAQASAWIVHAHRGGDWQTFLLPGPRTDLDIAWRYGGPPDIVAVIMVDRVGVESDPVVLRLSSSYGH